MDTQADNHASGQHGAPKLLERFRDANPHLKPLQDARVCNAFWRLLSPRHREDKCCSGVSLLDGMLLDGNHLADHMEIWQDTERGYYLYVAHPYCDCSNCPPHQKDTVKLSEQGLTYRKSSASWYSPGRAYLTLLGRPEVVDAVDLGDDELDLPTVMARIKDREYGIEWDGPLVSSGIDAEMIEAKRLAEEQVLRDRYVRDAITAETEGDFQLALNRRCDVAYTDRTGGFHKQARKQLDECKRLMDKHPELDVSFLFFANEKDRRLICGPASPSLSKRELERRLASIETPFRGRWRVSDGKRAFCNFQEGETRWQLDVTQDGNLQLWSSAVERLGGDEKNNPYIHTRLDGKPRVWFDYCHESAEAAAKAAIDLWRRYDQEVQARAG